MCVFLLLLNPPCALSLVQTAFSRQGAQKQAQVRFPNDYTMPYSVNQAFFTKKQRKTEVLRRKSQNVVSVACKPSSVEGGHLSRPIVTDGFKRNPESIDGPSQALFRFLLRAGFTSRTSRQAAGELLPHLSTLTRRSVRYLSVALSLGSPPPGVTRHSALRSSDFPHTLRRAAARQPHKQTNSITFLSIRQDPLR